MTRIKFGRSLIAGAGAALVVGVFITACGLLTPAQYQNQQAIEATSVAGATTAAADLKAAQDQNAALKAQLAAATNPAQVTALQGQVDAQNVVISALTLKMNTLAAAATQADAKIAKNDAAVAAIQSGTGAVAVVGSAVPGYGTIIAGVAAAVGAGFGIYQKVQSGNNLGAANDLSVLLHNIQTLTTANKGVEPDPAIIAAMANTTLGTTAASVHAANAPDPSLSVGVPTAAVKVGA